MYYPTGMNTGAILIQANYYVCFIHTYFNVELNTANLYNTGVNSTIYHYLRREHGIPLAQYVLEVEILFLISNFRRVLNLVYFLLGISPASE
jgi:DNA-binding GntR family transcriptional regulator